MEEKVRPSQHVTTLTTHTHAHTHTPAGHNAFTAARHFMCYTTFPLIPRQPKGQQIMYYESGAKKVLKIAAVRL